MGAFLNTSSRWLQRQTAHAVVKHVRVQTRYLTVRCACADSQQVLTACDDMQVHLYEASGNLIEAFSGHESWVLDVAAHPDGVHFLSSSSDSTVKLWDIPQRTCVTTAREHSDQVWSIALNPDGSEAASCGDDGKVVTYGLQ